MPVDKQRRIRELFDAASELPAAERIAWLSVQEVDDPQVRLAVKNLLDAANQSSGFLARPAWKRHEPVAREGRMIGPYKILRELGAGGMGVVYLSVRDDKVFHQLVALKVVREAGPLVEKFRLERQTLANLNHHNIARILDGGTTEDGLPYLVMDYIEGEPIDVFCNSQRADMTQRLNLVGQVCTAVEYLHASHVLHRDLKPENILVTKNGMVKLLDFGISKHLNKNFEVSVTGLPLMTPAYASPEQLLSKPMGPQSDVYSLGVVLYFLLTGRKPFDLAGKTLPEVIEITTQQDPMPASDAVVSAMAAGSSFAVPGRITDWKNDLEGDLSRIVAMALRKEPGRRYQSAQELAADLRRVQTNQPVLARGNSPGYVALKFLQRNRLPALATLIVAASLSVAIASAGYAYRAYRLVSTIRQTQAQVERVFEQMLHDNPQGSSQQQAVIRSQLQQMEAIYRQQITPMLSSPLAPRHEISRLTSDSVSYLNKVAPVAIKTPDMAKAVGDQYLAVSRLQWSDGGQSLHDPLAARATAQAALDELAPALNDPKMSSLLAVFADEVNRQRNASETASAAKK